ncbi:MAG: heavy-metal-associated domain-containing protein [Gammaproteobacteria bacterium]|nr:heavy-metal-associated domain-containing protein [Gammaproteobacteria bacterium]
MSKIETFVVTNVKCGGCAANIEKGMTAVSGVAEVAVDVASQTVTVKGDNLDRSEITATLQSLGYPEK